MSQNYMIGSHSPGLPRMQRGVSLENPWLRPWKLFPRVTARELVPRGTGVLSRMAPLWPMAASDEKFLIPGYPAALILPLASTSHLLFTVNFALLPCSGICIWFWIPSVRIGLLSSANCSCYVSFYSDLNHLPDPSSLTPGPPAATSPGPEAWEFLQELKGI